MEGENCKLAVLNLLVKSLPASLCQREERGFPLLTKGDEGGLDRLFFMVNKPPDLPHRVW